MLYSLVAHGTMFLEGESFLHDNMPQISVALTSSDDPVAILSIGVQRTEIKRIMHVAFA